MNKIMNNVIRGVIYYSLSCTIALAVDVNPGNDGLLTQAEFDRAQNSAGVNGTLYFRQNMETNEALSINFRGLTLIGNKPGGGRVRLTRRSANRNFQAPPNPGDTNEVPSNLVDPNSPRSSLFRINQSNVSFTNFHMRAQHTPLLIRNAGSSRGEATVAAQGVDQAIRVLGQQNNLSVTNCTFDRLNTGIWYRRSNLPDGLELRDIDATVAKGVLNCVDDGPTVREFFNNPMRLTDVVANYRFVPRRNFASLAMFTFDYGNNPYSSGILQNDFPVVNFRNSIIRNCRALGMTSWAIDMNRCRNVRIENCALTVGNFRETFTNALHFEAGTRSVSVTSTTLRVNRVGGNVVRLGSHVFSAVGGGSQHPPFNITFRNCRFRGAPDIMILGILRRWTFRGTQSIRVDESSLRAVTSSALRADIATIDFIGGDNNEFNRFAPNLFQTGNQTIRQAVDNFNASRNR